MKFIPLVHHAFYSQLQAIVQHVHTESGDDDYDEE